MANVNRAQTGRTATPVVDDIPDVDVPDEVNTDDMRDGQSTSHSSGEKIALTLKDLQNYTINHEQDEAEAQKLLTLPGDWFKDDRWDKVDINIAVGDCEEGDYDPRGRLIIHIQGQPQPRYNDDGLECNAYFNLFLSPDKRSAPWDEKVADSNYQLWLKAERLYFDMKQQKTDNPMDIIHMLVHDEYYVNTSNSKTSGKMYINALKVKGTTERRKRQ